jgi:H+/Cl- antiporter ClcA/CBS domain-containing protein
VDDRAVERRGTKGALPVAPSLEPGLGVSAGARRRLGTIDQRVIRISVLAIGVALAAGGIAQILTRLIGLITNLSFYGKVSATPTSPADNHLGWLVVVPPIVGGIVVGLMARYGSKAIRGHGIPEAMEQVLFNQSRIPARVTFLKPLSAAVSIGTGGPFGAEGPIIATGGALGSLVGQVLAITADERKTLLAAGAAAGMAATFGSPVSAVLLAIELLLFEYRARSLVPVALAAAAATGVRIAFVGSAPAFPVSDLAEPHAAALVIYVVLGALVGLASVLVTRAVYGIEDLFERLPIHWMWWPALGAIPVGVIGYFAPRTLGVGYDNIIDIVSGTFAPKAIAVLCAMKFLSWAFSLGSGTSGGTLAPLLTVGGGLGALLGLAASALLPHAGVDPRVAALVGMAALFAGASRALLASVVFAFEATRQPLGLLPLLGGCTAAYLVSALLMRTTIMTEKLARRGARIPSDYVADFLDQVLVRDVVSSPAVVLDAGLTIGEAREVARQARHQGYPIVDAGAIVGLVTRRELEAAEPGARVGSLAIRPPISVTDDSSLRDAADLMVAHRIGRLPVVEKDAPSKVVGIVTRSDLLHAHARRIAHEAEKQPSIRAARRLGGQPKHENGAPKSA